MCVSRCCCDTSTPFCTSGTHAGPHYDTFDGPSVDPAWTNFGILPNHSIDAGRLLTNGSFRLISLDPFLYTKARLGVDVETPALADLAFSQRVEFRIGFYNFSGPVSAAGFLCSFGARALFGDSEWEFGYNVTGTGQTYTGSGVTGFAGERFEVEMVIDSYTVVSPTGINADFTFNYYYEGTLIDSQTLTGINFTPCSFKATLQAAFTGGTVNGEERIPYDNFSLVES